tara:strand:+ start:656 stop:988 length:333 start_codon:yes stop_codon:yes gene_type:complete
MSQIFKNKIPDNILYDFIKKIGEENHTDNMYIISKNSYKKSIMSDDLETFYNEIKKYYYISKKFYIERKRNYKNFITIIRQICKFNKIPFSSKIFYSKSSYEIKYFIYNK